MPARRAAAATSIFGQNLILSENFYNFRRLLFNGCYEFPVIVRPVNVTGQPTAWGLTGSWKTEYVPHVKGLVVNWGNSFSPL